MGLFGRAGKGDPFDWLVVGLGNPGQKYARTRHNVGEETIARLAVHRGVKLKGGRDNALVAETRFGDQRVVLAFPLTFMNDSGQAVSALVRRYRVESPEQLIVVHDELDLPPGELKIKAGGGLAGHNGLRSIKQHLKSQDFLRVRIGVGKPDAKELGKGHVLSKVPRSERELLDITVHEAAGAVEAIITEGIDAAMRQFNSKRA
ncbi:MAG: aminoacyl-tRNA hydrolase [Ilumatobacteraceae bacterium]|nr:aminoacyl-tRNA hydrolase [Ilumatobacteraceae bacterium]